ncbi:MAG TPA: hypothetical protein PKC67_02575 [Kiritimatiellia bacterium]|nr:hypothetical protein [Kiritimatiellia bacterium]HMP33211.1 hypothetical protein [Kiritimatiellia bacterium]
MKKISLLLAVLGLTGCLAQAQVVTTLSASNVTAWSAQLYGSYAGLVTGRTYSGSIFYGLTNGGTNELAWSKASSGFVIEPSGTGDVAGIFSRTVVELVPTNTYYFRARIFDFDTMTTTWATQSLTFVTGNPAPTVMPGVAFAAVTVDTNGVLHSPPDFFEKNGIQPTQGVDLINARLGSNEQAITTMRVVVTSRVVVLQAGFDDLDDPSILLLDAYGNEKLFIGYNTNSMSTDPLVVRWKYPDSPDTTLTRSMSSDDLIVNNRRILNEINFQQFFGSGLTSTAFVVGGGYSYRLFGTNQPGFFSPIIGTALPIWWSGNQGSGTGMDADLLDGIDSTNLVRWSGGNITARTVNVQDRFTIRTNGPDVVLNYSGFGNLVITMGSSTAAVFTGSAVTFPSASVGAQSVVATNSTSYFGPTYGNGLGWTNIPLTGLRLANNYTGGVMRLVTTDGVTFFLQ